MSVRGSMGALITRTRLLINDTAGVGSEVFTDLEVQEALDQSRRDIYNGRMEPKPTFNGGTLIYLDYFAQPAGWEDDYILKQYLTVLVTPSAVEPIVGHFQFAASVFPPVFITGKIYDVYRAAADLLERWAAKYATRFDFSSDGQSFHVSQAPMQLQKLADSYRRKQRPGAISMTRGDLSNQGANNDALSLAPQSIDFMASGDGR